MRKKTKIFTGIGFSLLMIAVLMGCSTSRNTFPNRAYHNVTCKYNVYWNGNQAMKDAEREYAKLSKDNFTATLPIYNYPDKSELGPCLSHLDRTIEKSSKAIHKHSMMIKGKEYVKTIDDAYFLMAKAYFYKQDYVQAQRVLNYIAHTYPKSNVLNEAQVLLARTQMRQGYYSSADELLETLRYQNDKKKKSFAVLFNAAKAEYHLTAPDGDTQEAIDYIGNALANKPKREFRTRLQLILGELYENLGQQAEAQKNFRDVIKKSNDYEMTFCAQMHLAANYDGTESNRNAITKQLNKMLTDKKNEDYKDQIYYAFSEIARIDEDDDSRIEYLAKSVAASTDNNYQKTYSSITLADLYFDKNEYREAQHYYDTAMMSIPKNYPKYEDIEKKSNVLKDLVDKLDEIDLQDSLLRIANLPEGQRNAWVRKMIADYTEAERKAAAEEAERMLAMQNAASYSNINTTSSNGKWYFYNQSLVTAGQQDFYRRFGNRKLEDNWFISNKVQISFDDMALMNDPSLVKDTVDYDEDGNPIAKRETDPKKEAYYLQDLPLTKGAKDTANAIIAKDLYETGFMYQDLLNDTKRACASFESLLQRYPKSEYALPAIFMLYTLYNNAGDPKAETYKNTLLTQYPETDYAKLIQDPEYYNKLAEKEKVLEYRYAEVYEDFIQKRWKNVITAADNAIPNCTDVTLQSQYAYLRAIAAGQVYNQDTLIVGLTNLVASYKDQPVAELARYYLSNYTQKQIQDALGIVDTSSSQQAMLQEVLNSGEPQKQSVFTFNPNEQHYVVLLVKTAELPLQTVKQDLSTFNKTYFSLKKLIVSSFFIDNKRQMVTISKFENSSDAIDYYNLLVKNEVFLPNIQNSIIEVYAMGANNYTTFYNKRDERDSYPAFFKENYLNKK